MRARCLVIALITGVALGAAGASFAARASAETHEAGDVEESAGPPANVDIEVEDPDPLLEAEEDEELADESSRRDPFEELNRDVFGFNRTVDHYLFNPVTRGYQIAVPTPGRRALFRFFQNLDSPMILANHMLQFRVADAAGTTTRFVINSSIGIVGLFDPAADFFQVPRREGDFGQTLARYGTPSGPFLMLPVFGPSTVRDVFGDVVDILADPVSYVLGPVRWWTLALGGGEGLTTREAHYQELEELEKGSVDFYSALRSAYLQSRDGMVREARESARLWRESGGAAAP
jgi:phospholipid-binding lipoprotein MlaA